MHFWFHGSNTEEKLRFNKQINLISIFPKFGCRKQQLGCQVETEIKFTLKVLANGVFSSNC